MDLVFSPTDGSEWKGVLEADGLRVWRAPAGTEGWMRHGWYIGGTDAVVDGEPWSGWEVSTHTPRQAGADGVLISDGCVVLDATCWYDSDTAAAHRLMREITRTGDWSLIWPVLAGHYRRRIAARMPQA